jgi:hypothetical protein
MTDEFFTQRFKTLWCPIGGQHDWQGCMYAHTYQDARRVPTIGYGHQLCPYWNKKETSLAYAQRCPLGPRCPYSHGAKEQLYHPGYFRTLICRDLQRRRCPRAALCAFYHRQCDARQAGADEGVDYNNPLPKEALPAEWTRYFMCPPRFQEGEHEGAPAAPGVLRPFPALGDAGGGGPVLAALPNPRRLQASPKVFAQEEQAQETPRTQTTTGEGDDEDSVTASSQDAGPAAGEQSASAWLPASTAAAPAVAGSRRSGGVRGAAGKKHGQGASLTGFAAGSGGGMEAWSIAGGEWGAAAYGAPSYSGAYTPAGHYPAFIMPSSPWDPAAMQWQAQMMQVEAERSQRWEGGEPST